MANHRGQCSPTPSAYREGGAAKEMEQGESLATSSYALGQRTGKAKQPYCFEVNEGQLFAFAGLWDRWKDPSGNWLKSCSILTTTPNAVTSAVHDRMPVILDPDCYDLWLDPGMHDMSAVSDMLKPFDAGLMRCYPSEHRVNHVANDDDGCSTPVQLDAVQTQTSLF